MEHLRSKVVVVSGRGIPLRGNNIDTDRIIPARFLKEIVFDDLGNHAFEDDRAQKRARGEVHPFDDDRFRGAAILIVNKNFGCGSSREHAAQSLARWGIKAVVGETFSEIFYGNCLSVGVPCVALAVETIEALQQAVKTNPDVHIQVDIETKKIQCGSIAASLEMTDGARRLLLDGQWDTTEALLAAATQIDAVAARLPYLHNFG